MARRRSVSKGVAEMIDQKMIGSTPAFDPTKAEDAFAIDMQVIHALNWFNSMANEKKEKNWFIEYCKHNSIFSKADLAKLKDWDPKAFSRIGRYCKMLLEGFPIESWAEPKYINPLIAKLKDSLNPKKKRKQQQTTETTGPSIQDRINEKAAGYASEIESVIDAFIFDIRSMDKKKDGEYFDIDSFMELNDIKPLMAGRIIPRLEPSRDEWMMVVAEKSKNAEIREAYSTYTASDLKRIIKLYDLIFDGLVGKSEEKKKRKPRKKKQKPASEVVKAVKYLSETKEYGGLKSILPVSLVGSNRFIMFNTKYRELSIFEAEDERIGLSVKGTTLQGFDSKKSVTKRIREKQVPDMLRVAQSQGIRAIRKQFDTITSKENTPTGRINGDCILLKVLK